MKKREIQSFRRAARFFQKVQPKLLSRHKGDIVAVDPASGRYFVGHDELEVAREAIAALPGKIFGFFRVGYPAVHKFRSSTIVPMRKWTMTPLPPKQGRGEPCAQGHR